MQGTIQSYVLYMADDVKKEPLKVKQCDTNSRWAKITLKAFEGEYWLIPFDAQIYINVHKTDGTLATATCTKVDEHTVLAPITEQMTAVTGTQSGELYFLAPDGDIKSQTFPIAVYPMVMDQARIESSDDFQSLQEALRDVKVSTEAADIAAQYATEQGNQARDGAQRANDAADSIQVAVDAAANAKACESNAKDSETAAAQTQQAVTDYVEAQKAAFVGYSQRESDSKYANALTETSTGEGDITVEDAWTAPVLGLEVMGRSEQAVTTGAQLLLQPQFNDTKNGITVKTQTDGGISITGTATAAITFTVAEILILAGDYTLSGLSGLVVGRMYFQLVEISAQGGQFVGELAKVGHVASTTITIDRDVWARAEIKVLSGVTADSVCYPMLNAGTTALPWEPYTGGAPSPSPEYPQDIISTGTVSTGAQLLNLSKVPDQVDNNVTSYKYTDGGLTCVFSAKNYGVRFKVSVQPNTIYTISSLDISTGGYLSISDFLQSDKNGVSVLVSKGQNSKTFNSGTATELTFTMYSADDNYLTVVTRDIMLNAGDTALPWEPYTGGKPSPSVEYPQPLEVRATGKNLYDTTKTATAIHNGTISKIENDEIYFTANGSDPYFGDVTNAGTKHSSYLGQIQPLMGATRISLIPTNKWFDKNYFIFWNADAVSLGFISASSGAVDVPKDAVGFTVRCGHTTSSTESQSTKIQVQYESESMDYEPYKGNQTAPITLTEPLRGIGEYRDRIMCRDGVWGVERNTGEWIFDGSADEVWRKYELRQNAYYIDVQNTVHTGTSIVMADKLIGKVSGTGGSYKDLNVVWLQSTPDYPRLYINYLADNLEELRSKLQASPITVIYQLAKPIWEPLPSATQQALNELTTYAGTTHLTITAGGPAPTVTLDYVQDTHKALEQCQEAAKEYTDTQIAAIVAALPTATQAAIVDNQTTRLLQEV